MRHVGDTHIALKVQKLIRQEGWDASLMECLRLYETAKKKFLPNIEPHEEYTEDLHNRRFEALNHTRLTVELLKHVRET